MSELSPKVYEMIALGVAYSLNCHKCLKIHKQAARKAGVTDDEMRLALNAADTVVQGAGKLTQEFAAELFKGEIKAQACCTDIST